MELATINLYMACLGVERLFYGLIWKKPEFVKSTFQWDDGYECEHIFTMVGFFKVVQATVFTVWFITRFGLTDFDLYKIDTLDFVISALFISIGQVLNWAVWKKLGIDGVCYGVKYDKPVPWITSFPYNIMNDPQYIGAICTVWGLFLLSRSQAPADWYIIPVIETGLYGASILYLEK
jgi:protein-S-isoprenylcysteine O-methyltransferase Ste14